MHAWMVVVVNMSSSMYIWFISFLFNFYAQASLDFVKSLFQHLNTELKRIHDVGVPKVLVTNLHPIGCTPYMTRATNYTKCDSAARWEAQAHNQMLENLIKELNIGAGTNTFFGLDLFTAFDSIINQGEVVF